MNDYILLSYMDVIANPCPNPDAGFENPCN